MYLARDFGPEDDRTIFHYTDAAGLDGILKTRTIWASSINYLNDSKEIYYARDLVRNYVNANYDSEVNRLLIELAIGHIFPELGGDLFHAQIYVTSFSAKCDDLSQWRAYASKHGYCIGFAPSMLTEHAKQQGFSLEKVCYKKEDQEVLIKPIADSYLSASRELSLSAGQLQSLTGRWPWKDHEQLMELANNFRDSLLPVAPLLKDRSFSEEEEWRLVSQQNIKQEFEVRITDNGIVPYTVISLLNKDNDIGESVDIGVRVIVTGPSPRMNLNHISSLFVVSKYNVSCGSYTITTTPYRNW